MLPGSDPPARGPPCSRPCWQADGPCSACNTLQPLHLHRLHTVHLSHHPLSRVVAPTEHAAEVLAHGPSLLCLPTLPQQPSIAR